MAEKPTDRGNGEYEVGYGKPPKHTQFGVPGTGNAPNRPGKPKGAVSIKAAIRRRVRDRKLADALADQAIDLALAQDAKVGEVLALGTFHDQGLPEEGEAVEAAEQRHTKEQQRQAVVAWLRKKGEEGAARALEGEA